ncbi:hypothetical protein ACVWZ4_001085 [Bradyrhizobium sp. USDA 4472]
MIVRCVAKRPRWHVHLTPTSSSWLNQVEHFFALLTGKKIRHDHAARAFPASSSRSHIMGTWTIGIFHFNPSANYTALYVP